MDFFLTNFIHDNLIPNGDSLTKTTQNINTIRYFASAYASDGSDFITKFEENHISYSVKYSFVLNQKVYCATTINYNWWVDHCGQWTNWC